MSGGRPRKLDYEVVSNLRRNGLSVTAIAASFHVSREAVYHALRQGPGPGEATAAEMRAMLVRCISQMQDTASFSLRREAQMLIDRGG